MTSIDNNINTLISNFNIIVTDKQYKQYVNNMYQLKLLELENNQRYILLEI